MVQIIALLTAKIQEGGFITNEVSNKVLPKAGSYFNNAGTGDIIDGFTIRKGYVTGDWPAGSGGGIYCDTSSPSIINCIISGNFDVQSLM